MKKLYTTLLLAILAVTAVAQSKPNRMTVTTKDGQATTYVIADIDSISFSYVPDTPQPDPMPSTAYEVKAPASFADGDVVKVMADGKQVAEIDYEYIKSENARKVVVYPMAANGKTDLTKGLSLSDGGSVVWDMAKNTVTYTAGTAPLSTVYVVDGEVVASTTAEKMETTQETDLLVDKRAFEEKKYKIVKIGTQYWMAENLAATFFADGTVLERCNGDEADKWKDNTAGAYHIVADNAENIGDVYGYMYNGYAVVSTKSLAPEGWEIPSYEQMRALRSYAGATAANYRSTTPNSWLENMDSNTNLTGFNALPGGYFTAANGDEKEGMECFWWSSTSKYDALSKSDGIVPMRITATGKNTVVTDLTLHDYLFGHYVRCVRK